MKKLILSLLSAACLVSFAGCGNTLAENQPDSQSPLVVDESASADYAAKHTTESAYTTETDALTETEPLITETTAEITTISITAAETEAETTTVKTTTKATAKTTSKTTQSTTKTSKPAIDKNGSYTSKDDVALYIHTYGKLPSNFITKKEAEKLGWTGGSLEPYAKGKSIGGSTFGNYEGLLPKKKGRTYTECDIDTKGQKNRGAKRIVFSNDGLIYYTDDHYATFTLLYGEESS